ncbi:PHF5-like protein-domain-containing protein [Xylariaceae sp. FL1651]|nr:PHF5-like protein-domain-containing protein [Xylariaceae sp. FL1651]
MCRKQSGIAIGRLCDKCDGKCPVCDSYVRPTTLVRICDECSFGNYQNKCVVCGGEGISDAFYCFECTRLEKDRDGCPKIINLGSSRTDVSLPASCPLVPFSCLSIQGSCRCGKLRYVLIVLLFVAVILPKENKSDRLLTSVMPGSGLLRTVYASG